MSGKATFRAAPVWKREGAIAQRRVRRGSILVLVMTILGLLFVTGVAFMATMNFEAQRMRYESQRSDANPAVGRLMHGMDDVMSDAMSPATNVSFSGLMLGSTKRYAELPGVDNLFSQIEPTKDAFGNYFWSWVTDIKALRPASPDRFVGSAATMTPRVAPPGATPYEFHIPVSLAWRPGVDPVVIATLPVPPTPLDADGDGVSDSYETPLVDVPGLDDKQIDELKKTLNPQFDPDGDLSLGLRVIPHGGLVNLTYSHPSLIANVLGTTQGMIDAALNDAQDNWPYNPGIEEPQLRRRNFLLPQQLTPSGILGNPLIAQTDPTGGGDYSQFLFAIGDALDKHRYWPYGNDELGTLPDNPPNDPDIRIHSIRLDPDYPSSAPLQYFDRRHLVTSISHDANIRRSVPLIQHDPPVPATFGNDEILNLMHERNIEACPTAAGALLPFELANYPYNLRNEAKIVIGHNETVDHSNYCECMLDTDPTTGERLCKLDPRKGQLKLSLRELDSITNASLRERLIYDTFIMMLLNARESTWGVYVGVLQPDGSTKYEWRWNTVGLQAISLTAASLTANMIDYMDGDFVPTEIDVRSLDFSNIMTLGNNTGTFVYGLERQPFITEVMAQVEDDGTGSIVNEFYGVEIFNPYSASIDLTGYSIVTNAPLAYPLSGQIPSGGFIAYYGPNAPPPEANATGTQIQVPLLKFTENGTIKLFRTVPGSAGLVDMLVDQFTYSGDLGKKIVAPAPFISHQRSATSNPAQRWTAPIPSVYEAGTPTLGAGSATADYDFTLPPVYLGNADTGTFASAFLTPGMMLMLSRHANTQGAAFTVKLNDPAEQGPAGQLPIDNGRMPVFDPYVKHRYPADDDPTNGGGAGSSVNRPGDVMHLPWGQFVFDYFTTLPVSSPGPYDDSSGTAVTVNPLAPPKVDMDGLRVHGRININAAPWKVLEGLPFTQLNLIPQVDLQNAFQLALSPPTGGLIPTTTVTSIGPERAKAIVAYRELREFLDPMNPLVTLTGNYDLIRGWTAAAPDITTRRGPGYMTIGELANVRHYGSAAPFSPPGLDAYQLDAGQLDPTLSTAPDYLSAIAFLACLQDWATVRSDTFTVYGTLRGVEDQTIIDDTGNVTVDQDLRTKDVDSRALRFQETISRIPMFGGSAAPSRIGDRVIARYIDARGD